MNLYVLDENFETVKVIDVYESFIWSDRYNEAGDFELYTTALQEYWDVCQRGYYLYFQESAHLMIIEDREIMSSFEDGVHLIVTGRSLESILERRVVWGQVVFEGMSVKDIIIKLLNDNIISPSDSDRKIPNFILGDFQNETEVRSMTATLDAQYTGDDLYSIIKNLCQVYGLGFKITLNESNQFVFDLYEGKDRTYGQFENPYIVFSPSQENITSSNYKDSDRTLKTVALVLGEGEGYNRKFTSIQSSQENSLTGLSRRELYVDARDISSTTEEGDIIESDEYYKMLQTRGSEKLAENVVTQVMDGEVDPYVTYEYKKDYDMGDIVQIVNELGMEMKARVSEYIYSHDESGLMYYPTFVNFTDSDIV